MLETRVGFRPAGVEVRPLLGWVRGIEGLAAGTGLGAAGLTIGPFAGRLLADLVTGRPQSIDLGAFDPMRHAVWGPGDAGAAAVAGLTVHAADRFDHRVGHFLRGRRSAQIRR